MGPPKRGKLFWDRWLQEYYADRVPVTVRVERIVAWPDAEAAGEPRVYGAPLPADPPPAAGRAEERHRAARRRREGGPADRRAPEPAARLRRRRRIPGGPAR